jgi:hypothetical protein
MARMPKMVRWNISLASGIYYSPIFLFLFPNRLFHSVKTLCVHISDCVETEYELPLLPNHTASETFYTNRKRYEVLTGYLLLGRWTGGD